MEKRLYYSIKDVANISGLKQYVLRYWETEFKELKPLKNKRGQRTYRIQDIKLLFFIKHLLYDKGLTIQGARQIISKQNNLFDARSIPEQILREDAKQGIIKEVTAELKNLLEYVENQRIKLKD